MIADALSSYERERAQRIQENNRLLMELGLYKERNVIKPKSPTKSSPTRTALKRDESSSSTSSTSQSSSSSRASSISSSSSSSSFTPPPLTIELRRSSRSIKSPSHSDSDYNHLTSLAAYARGGSKRARLQDEYDDLSRFIQEDGEDDENDTRQRKAQRLGHRIHNPKRFGHIPGIKVGHHWEQRIECSRDAVHGPTVSGISGNIEKGCWSVCLSGGYEDDVDLGDYFTYTGSGGRDLKGTADKPKNLRTAPQTKDQKFEGMNAALRRSVETKNPIRVIRGFKAKNKLYAPPTGYVYSGLYIVERAWMEKGLSGFKVCKYSFKRCPNQPRLPRFDPGGMEVVIVVPNLPTLSPKTREEEEEEEEEERTPPRRSERLSRVGIPNLEREKEEEEEGEDAFDVDLLL